MNEQKYNQVKAAIEAQRAKGVKLIAEEWGVSFDPWARAWIYDDAFKSPCACAIGCLLLEREDVSEDSDQAEAGAYLLGATTREIDAFTTGFDGLKISVFKDRYPEWFEAGARMRDELLPAKAHADEADEADEADDPYDDADTDIDPDEFASEANDEPDEPIPYRLADAVVDQAV